MLTQLPIGRKTLEERFIDHRARGNRVRRIFGFHDVIESDRLCRVADPRRTRLAGDERDPVLRPRLVTSASEQRQPINLAVSAPADVPPPVPSSTRVVGPGHVDVGDHAGPPGSRRRLMKAGRGIVDDAAAMDRVEAHLVPAELSTSVHASELHSVCDGQDLTLLRPSLGFSAMRPMTMRRRRIVVAGRAREDVRPPVIPASIALVLVTGDRTPLLVRSP